MATPAGTVSAVAAGGAHTWEETNVSTTWESAVQEDEQGRIVLQGAQRDSLSLLLRARRRRLEQNDYSLRNKRLRRDMIRYLYVVFDGSRWMREKDPTVSSGQQQTRLEATVELLLEFVQAYFDENPLSHLGFVLVRNGEAEILSKLSCNIKAHKLALQSVQPLILTDTGGSKNADGGEFSLQNGLEVAGRSLGHQPRHASREIVVVTAALSTCDPGFLLTETLPRLLQAHIRVSALALSAELYVCRKITLETAGSMGVVLDRIHFREWLLNQTVPPPTHSNKNNLGEEACCEMVHMGFPSRVQANLPSLVHASAPAHAGSGTTTLLARTSYNCPQCQAKNAELPTDCAVCGLKLVLSPHLARTFHHLFPVPQFSEVVAPIVNAATVEGGKKASIRSNSSGPTLSAATAVSSSSSASVLLTLNDQLLINSLQDDTCCFACARPLLSTNTETGFSEWLRFACPECDNVFCFDCDAFLHETLHNCPGCLGLA